MAKIRKRGSGIAAIMVMMFLLTALLPVAAQAADSISLSDIVMAAKLMRSSENPTQEEIKKYDLTGDGRLTLSDVIAMARAYADSKPGTVQKPVDENNTPVTVDDDAMAAEVRQLFIDGINEVRAKKGIGPLPVNTEFTEFCQAWIDEMVSTGNGSAAFTALSEAKEAAGVNTDEEWQMGMSCLDFVPGSYSSAKEVMEAFAERFLQEQAYMLENLSENEEYAIHWTEWNNIFDQLADYVSENTGAFGIAVGHDDSGWYYYCEAYWNE